MHSLNSDCREQIENTYKLMAKKGKYQPEAPSDGYGNIDWDAVKPLDEEAADYADKWWAREDTNQLVIDGYANFPFRPAQILALNAAQLCCGAYDAKDSIKRMLRLALKSLEGVE